MARTNRSPMAVMVALLVALPFLAWLQYRWIGQVSRAERERMQADLRNETAAFADEFNALLRGVYGKLEIGGPAAADDKLIQEIYNADGGDLSRFDRERGAFEPVPWPPQLAGLRDRPDPERGPPPRHGPPERHEHGPPGGYIDEGVLLLMPYERRPGGGVLIAELNAGYIEKELLPRLARKHFAAGEDAGYAVRIVDRGREARLIYQSDPALAASFFSSPDAETTVFDVHPSPPGGPGGRHGPHPPPFENSRGGGPGRWDVLIKRRAGSLDSAVNQARWRNLGVSFAILSVLAASFVMLLTSSRRAQRLAELQIQFVAGVSHELRTPLAVICSAGDNLADGVVANPAQVALYGGLIRTEGRRLSEMVEQIMRFAGIEVGRARYEPKPVVVADAIHRALESCQAARVESHCAIDEQIDPDLPRVMADETSLAHCVGNLVSNALKYGRQGKWVGVRARMAENGHELRISVEDKGPGIDSADLPHVFDPFYRGSRAVSDQIHGAGLGLCLVKRIMEAQGGSVEAANRRDGGASFTLRIKVENATAHLTD